MIGGVNFNNPIDIRSNIPIIRQALQGGSSPLQQLNREFVAAQLSLASAGGSGSPAALNALNGRLGCYGLNFAPVRLSNGFTLSPNSTLNDLFQQARSAIRENRTTDMLTLAGLFDQLNRNDPSGRCG
jgi:hypothetical protein